ncbi:MAG: FecR family protein [Dysgonamonadaceae bacterium]|jgi:ferric-dicitrate binding protein FerR (iron transport regulator)|nr:FecR family protein [Dysgonamonadaceae bacterium]
MEGKEINIENVFAQYFSGELSFEDSKILQDWITTSPENKKQFLAMKDIWCSTTTDSDEQRFDKMKAYQRFLLHKEKKIIQPLQRKKNQWLRVWQAAAAVALLFIVSYAVFKQGGEQNTVQFADIRVETPANSRAKTSLPDGTIVWLNANSTLIYSQAFGIEDRLVHLTGEGYFEVQRNENLPFNVQTDGLQVNVLGTTFNVRNYIDDAEAVISLLEGKILVENHIIQGKDIEMNPGGKLLFDKKSGEIYLTKANENAAVAWINGYLFFDNELLSDIARELERAYNVKITVQPNVANLRFFAKFSLSTHNINDILSMLASTGQIKYNIEGNDIIIK